MLIRKAAHVTEYLILGILFFNALHDKNIPLRRTVAFSLLMGVFCACSDEVHQYFVPGRCASIKDVFIDSFGLSLGILFTSLITHNKLKKQDIKEIV